MGGAVAASCYNGYYASAPVVVSPTVVAAPTVVTTPAVVAAPTVVSQPAVVAAPAVQNVWVEGRYVDQVQGNGTIVRVWQPGHYEARQVIMQ